MSAITFRAPPISSPLSDICKMCELEEWIEKMETEHFHSYNHLNAFLMQDLVTLEDDKTSLLGTLITDIINNGIQNENKLIQFVQKDGINYLHLTALIRLFQDRTHEEMVEQFITVISENLPELAQYLKQRSMPVSLEERLYCALQENEQSIVLDIFRARGSALTPHLWKSLEAPLDRRLIEILKTDKQLEKFIPAEPAPTRGRSHSVYVSSSPIVESMSYEDLGNLTRSRGSTIGKGKSVSENSHPVPSRPSLNLVSLGVKPVLIERKMTSHK